MLNLYLGRGSIITMRFALFLGRSDTELFAIQRIAPAATGRRVTFCRSLDEAEGHECVHRFLQHAVPIAFEIEGDVFGYFGVRREPMSSSG